MEDFKERLIKWRKVRGMSQPELAEAVGVSADTLRRWEWGKQVPRLDELVRLADILNISVGELAANEKPNGMITIQRGDVRLDIPATPEGFAFVEGKLKEFTAGESSPEPLPAPAGEQPAS